MIKTEMEGINNEVVNLNILLGIIWLLKENDVICKAESFNLIFIQFKKIIINKEIQ